MSNVNDIVRATLIGSNDGDLVVNTFHFVIASLTGSPSDANIATDIQDIVGPPYVTLNGAVHTGINYSRIDHQNVTQNVIMASLPTSASLDGLSAQDPLPKEIAAYVWWRTLKPKTRASKYLAGFTEGNSSGSALTAGLITSLVGFGDAFVGLLAGTVGTYRYVAYNQTLGTFEPVVSSHVQPFWRMQKRRRPGYGS